MSGISGLDHALRFNISSISVRTEKTPEKEKIEDDITNKSTPEEILNRAVGTLLANFSMSLAMTEQEARDILNSGLSRIEAVRELAKFASRVEFEEFLETRRAINARFADEVKDVVSKLSLSTLVDTASRNQTHLNASDAFAALESTQALPPSSSFRSVREGVRLRKEISQPPSISTAVGDSDVEALSIRVSNKSIARRRIEVTIVDEAPIAEDSSDNEVSIEEPPVFARRVRLNHRPIQLGVDSETAASRNAFVSILRMGGEVTREVARGTPTHQRPLPVIQALFTGMTRGRSELPPPPLRVSANETVASFAGMALFSPKNVNQTENNK